ncbi:MAG: aminotransferase class I/II-fold pyridoxal phosphate-dependent enzyme [Dehalococcoidia bacterium]|jgi:aspartate aminotransferase|nr:aminotransferase class I/II-fold pyridoxal phosphate-dependent enzyme [Dehalococcoidia bacterium]
MTAQLSAIAKAVKPSATLSLKNEITRIESAYKLKILDLTAGQPDVGPTPDVLAALVEGGKLHKYGPIPGEAGLRPLVAEVTNRETGSTFTAEQIVMTVGAKGGIDTVMRAILDPGDAVVVLAPYWVTYTEVVGICGGTSVCVPSKPDLHPDLKATAAAVQANRTKALLFSSPSNPTGAVYTRDELAELARIAREAGIWLIADEIYREFAFDGKTAPSIFSVILPYDKTVLIDGPSKRFGIPGWRLGFVAGPTELIKACSAILGHTSNASRPIQYAVQVAYTSEQARHATKTMVARYERNRDLFVTGLNAIKGISCAKPEGAFYCFPDVSALYGKSYEYDGGKATVKDSIGFRDFLLRRAFVAAVEGEPFGMDTNIRFSLAISEADCAAALKHITNAVAELHA